jgi:transposase InsO family protein
MSGKGDGWDEAPTESVFNSLGNERVHGRTFPMHAGAQADLLESTEVFYKRSRRHATLG